MSSLSNSSTLITGAILKPLVVNTTWMKMREFLMKEDADGVIKTSQECFPINKDCSKNITTGIGYFLSEIASENIYDPHVIEVFNKVIDFILKRKGLGASIDLVYFADWILFDTMKHLYLNYLTPQIAVFCSDIKKEEYKKKFPYVKLEEVKEDESVKEG